jgi:alpha-glucosidase
VNTTQHTWWQQGIIYQVYPRSFQDSNNDGIGDIGGIISRLDYLQWLGITIIWLSPVYPSPMKDFGYDISDYQNIHPLFGSLGEFENLVQQVHNRSMKIILDIVPNHSSDQHAWFKSSRSSKDSPKRNWYIWRDAAPGGGPPNNWRSVFGGSAWEWDPHTDQYYYHAFLKEQPDLNYREPDVVNAMMDVLQFWLERGIDGFRVDVMWHLIKDNQFRDNPPNPHFESHMLTYDEFIPAYSTDQPEVHDIVRSMRRVLDSYSDRMMIGEIYLPLEKLMMYYGIDNTGAHLPFNFLLLNIPWEAKIISSVINQYEAALPVNAWPNWVMGNHDQPRLRSRIGLQQARVAAMLLLTLRGTPTLYYGDEVGMQDVPIPFHEVQDPQGLNMPDKNLSRDPARTPMQWNSDHAAGFTTASPWLRVSKSYKFENVETEKADPDSILMFYKRLISLRQSEKALHVGQYRFLFADRYGIAYLREHENEDHFLILLNLSHRPCYFSFTQEFHATAVLGTAQSLEGERIDGNHFTLSGDEGVIFRLQKP